MDSDGLPIVGPGIDLKKVAAINQKRTLAFVNHYVTHTVSFLNHFSCVCEEKLTALSIKIQRLDTTMNILEAKLSSIPGLENITLPTSSDSTISNTDTKIEPNVRNQQTDTVKTTEDDSKNEKPTSHTEEPKNTVSKDPRYAKFLKMLNVGVPEMAVKQKMVSEGLNPELLNTPDAILAEDGGPSQSVAEDSDTDFSGDDQQQNQSDEDDSSSSGFSD